MCRVCRSTISLYENKTTTLQHVSGMSINNRPLREQDNDTAACVGYVDQQSASTRTRQRHCSMWRVCRSTIGLYENKTTTLQHVSGMSINNRPLREQDNDTAACVGYVDQQSASTRTRQRHCSMCTGMSINNRSLREQDNDTAACVGYVDQQSASTRTRQRHCSMCRVCRSTIGLYENKTTTLQHVAGMSINNQPLREQDNDTAACVGYVDQQSASTRTRQRHCSMCRVCRSTIGLYENKTTTLQHVSGMSINNRPLREQDNDTAACVGYVDQQSASTRTRQRHCSMWRVCRSTISLYENKTTTCSMKGNVDNNQPLREQVKRHICYNSGSS